MTPPLQIIEPRTERRPYKESPMLDFKAFAVENMRREFPVPSVETLLETAVKNAERWRAAYTQAQQQGEWTIARRAAEEVECWTNKAARYAAMQESA